MKKFSRKAIFIVILSLVLGLLLLSACNRNSNESNGNEETYANNIPPPPPQYKSVDADPLPSSADTPDHYIPAHGVIHQPIDLGGRTIRVASTGNGISFSHIEYEPDPATVQNYRIERMIWENVRRVRQSFNFEIENIMLPHDIDSELNVLQTSVMAGAPIADIAHLFANIIPAIMHDILVPLDSLNLPNSDVLGLQVFGQTGIEMFGERWSFSHNAPITTGIALGVNLDIINAIGAPNPVDLYLRGQWNWDNLLDIMRLAGGSGANMYGITSPPDGMIANFIAANDGRIITDDLLWDMDSHNTLEALEFTETFINEGLWTDGASEFWNWAIESNSAFFVTILGILFDELPFEFAVLPFPIGPSNTTGNVGIYFGGAELVFLQGSDWNQAEILMVIEEFWTWFGSEPELMLEVYLNWMRHFLPTEDDLHRLLYAGRNTNTCVGWMIPDAFYVFGNFAGYFQTREMSALQAVDMHRASQQEIIDNFFWRD